ELITTYFREKGIHIYIIRACTEEEQYVAHAKRNKLVYNPREVEWKTGFDQGPPPVIEFPR
ncbi:MAG: hypothetical protein V4658_00630, partial [Bacteroidota bacterium]